LLADIEKGKFDSDLQAIAKAAYERWQVIKEESPDSRLAEETPKVPSQPQDNGWRWLTSQVSPYAIGDESHDPSLRYIKEFDATWDRRRIIGKWFKILPGTFSVVTFDGLAVQVVGMGPKNMQIRFPVANSSCVVTDPDGSGKAYVSYARVAYLFKL